MAKSPVSEIDKQVGKRIQQYRKRHKLTAAALSEHIELSIQQLSRYERGVNKIPLDHLAKIANELNTPIDWFLIDEKQQNELVIANKVAENGEYYLNFSDKELENRLIKRFNQLSIEQKRLLVLFLDAIK